jgi:integrase
VRTYEQHARIYLKPAELGAIKVGEVQRTDVQDFADELLAKELAPGTVSNVLDPIRGFYRRAVDRGLIAVNPARAIDIPQPGSKRPKRIASGAEAAQLLDALPEPDRAMWATGFYAGLRRGELQALLISAVDLAGSRIHVEAGWDQYEGEIDPKSEAGRRTVPRLAVLRDYLDEHLLGIGRGDADLVFGPYGVVAVLAARDGQAGEGCLDGGGAEADHAPRVPPHLRLASDRLRGQPQGGAGVHGPLEDTDDIRCLRPSVPRLSR